MQVGVVYEGDGSPLNWIKANTESVAGETALQTIEVAVE